MVFTSKEERDSLIESFKVRAQELTDAKWKNPETKFLDKERKLPQNNLKVDFDHRTEYDTVVEVEGEISECSGNIYVFYIHQPTLDQSIRILTASNPPMGNAYNSGKEAWDVMIDKKESSPEVFQDFIKLGYLLRLVNKIDALLSDQKKR